MLIVRGSRIGVAEDVRDWWDSALTLSLGCAKISAGCKNCVAATMLGRDPASSRFVTARDMHRAEWTGHVETFPEDLTLAHVPADARVFVGPLSDLFHDDVPDDFLERVLELVRANPQTFGFLTKRPERMAAFFQWKKIPDNAWLGVSVEAPAYLDRVSHLRQIDCSIKWVSAEPLLAPIPVPDGIDWITAGPELGIHGRDYDVEWFRSLRDECKRVGVPFFMKHQLDGGEHREFPDVL